MSTVATQNVVKGKFGFYPCEWETYRKLKRLNYLAFLHRKAEKAHARWENKDPKNRFAVEPKQGCPRLRERVKTGKWETTPLVDIIYNDYREARYPKATAEEVKPLFLSNEQIDELLAVAEEWFKTLK